MTSQAVARDQPVLPIVSVLVELDGLADRRVFLRLGKQGSLRCLSVAFPHRLHDGARVNALVNVQGDGRHLERGVLGLPGPDELRIEVRVVGVGLLARVLVGLRRHQANRRVVHALLVGVRVVLNLTFFAVLRLRHGVPLSLGLCLQTSGVISTSRPIPRLSYSD